jgi:hypothetical protein
MNEFLEPGRFVDSAHPAVIDFSRKHAKGANQRARAVSLYYAVRDEIRYNPFQNFTVDESYRGSVCLERGVGWCVPKAALLAAAARAAGIPARVGFADVKNHLTSPRADRQTDGHGPFRVPRLHRAAIWTAAGSRPRRRSTWNCARGSASGRWSSTAREDSIFHPFDEDNRRHMEYVSDRGSFADVPVEEIKRVFAETYPRYYNLGPDAEKQEFAPA